MKIGFLRAIKAIELIFLVSVAEISTFLLFTKLSLLAFKMAKILLMVLSKPKSKSLSASSKISHESLFIEKLCVFLRWSNSLPGVATSTLTPFRRRAFSDFFFSPPINVPGTMLLYGIRIFLRISRIWQLSSRVGAKIRAFYVYCLKL